MPRYEGMFLLDSSVAREWPAIEQEVRRVLERADANLQVCVKFDERKLAYEIARRKRGTYALTYFDCDPNRIGDIERDARLSESILRLLILRQEVSVERLAELQARSADTALQPAGGDGRRSNDSRGRRDWGPRRHGGADEAKPSAPAGEPERPQPAPKTADIVSATIEAESEPKPPEAPAAEAPPAPPAEES